MTPREPLGLRYPEGFFETLVWFEDGEGNVVVRGQDLAGHELPERAAVQVARVPQELLETRLFVASDRSRVVATGTSTWDDALVTAMVRSMGWTAAQAALLCGVACDRCVAVLEHDLEPRLGFAFDSPEWRASTASCELCRPLEGEEGGGA